MSTLSSKMKRRKAGVRDFGWGEKREWWPVKMAKSDFWGEKREWRRNATLCCRWEDYWHPFLSSWCQKAPFFSLILAGSESEVNDWLMRGEGGPLKVVCKSRMTDHGFRPPLALMKTLLMVLPIAGKLTIAHCSSKKKLWRFSCTSKFCAFRRLSRDVVKYRLCRS